jgi:hypothetical protein
VPAPGYRPPDPERYPTKTPPPEKPSDKYPKPPSEEKYPKPPETEYGPHDPQYPEQPKPTPPENYPPAQPKPTPSDNYPSSQPKPEAPDNYPPAQPAPEPYKPEPKPPRRCPPSMNCDNARVDDLKCEAEGLKAEAAEEAGTAVAQENRKKATEAARTAYRTERTAAEAAVKALETRLKDLTGLIECKVHADRRPLIKSAFDEVLECIRECSETTDDRVPEDCGFTSEEWTTDRVAGLRARVEKVEKYFDEILTKEPEALKNRVAAVTKLVDDLAKAKDVEGTDWERLYVQALEAGWKLKMVYRPFDDANVYQDDLCRGLTCSLEGRRLLRRLVADKAFEDCQTRSRKTRCDEMRTNLVSETLAAVKQPSSLARETGSGRA